MKTRWDWYWLGWLIVSLPLTFAPVEFWAIFSGNSHDTLSDTTWKWENVNFAHPFNLAFWGWPHWLLAAFMLWITCELTRGSRRPVPDALV